MDLNQYSQVYKITYLPTTQYYIGITWGSGLPYTKRFIKHMEGNGGVFIKDLLLAGSQSTDFTVDLVYEGPLHKSIKIESDLSSLWPIGLNGNRAMAIVCRNAETKKLRHEHQSESMKKYLRTLSKEEMCLRMKKSVLNMTPEKKIERGLKISQGKRGKKTNQVEITKQRYRSMSENEFYSMIKCWSVGSIKRAINFRNGV